MAKNVLPVDFQDDILSEDMDGRRKYQMITNADGTVSFVDVTEYTQVGSNFGQAQINATNEAVNESADKNKIIDTKADLMANTQAGMIAGAMAVKEAVSELNENTGRLHFSQINCTTDQFGQISTIIPNSKIISAWCNKPRSFVVPVLEQGTGLCVYTTTNTSLTADNIKPLANTNVDVNVLYYDF